MTCPLDPNFLPKYLELSEIMLIFATVKEQLWNREHY